MNRAVASPTSCGESSWRKWAPSTVTVSWLGQAQQNSRTGPMQPIGPVDLRLHLRVHADPRSRDVAQQTVATSTTPADAPAVCW